MKHTRAQSYFFGGIFFWLVVLQGMMLGYLSISDTFICNAKGAWPFSAVPFLGGSGVTFLFTGLLFFWAWNSLKEKSIPAKLAFYKPFFWALIVATGLSHAVERVSSQCVLDYWHMTLFEHMVHFNLGDISLIIGVVFWIVSWFWEYKNNKH